MVRKMKGDFRNVYKFARNRPVAHEAQVCGASIELDRIGHTFVSRHGDSVSALSDISFRVSPGEFVSLIGPSGCGKSTLLRIVAGLISPTSGEVRISGGNARRTNSAFVFQKPTLLPWLTILDNCLIPLKLSRIFVPDQKDEARRLLTLVGLQGFERAYPRELSGGMQQRAAIARALITKPSLLLMDEPFGALDALTRDQMANELQRIWSETAATVLFVTHSIQEAAYLSDRIVVMESRPGLVCAIETVPFQRPRSLTVYEQPEFGRLTVRLREMLGQGQVSPNVSVQEIGGRP